MSTEERIKKVAALRERLDEEYIERHKLEVENRLYHLVIAVVMLVVSVVIMLVVTLEPIFAEDTHDLDELRTVPLTERVDLIARRSVSIDPAESATVYPLPATATVEEPQENHYICNDTGVDESPTVAADESDSCLGTFKITGYYAGEASGDPGNSASGIYLVPWRHCAMNRQRMRELGLNYGDTIVIDGVGEFIIADCGCSYGTIDVYVNTKAEAYSITGRFEVYRG